MKPEDRKVLIFLAVYLGWLGFVLGVVSEDELTGMTPRWEPCRYFFCLPLKPLCV